MLLATFAVTVLPDPSENTSIPSPPPLAPEFVRLEALPTVLPVMLPTSLPVVKSLR